MKDKGRRGYTLSQPVYGPTDGVHFTGLDKERSDAEALSLALGGLPIALEQAAAYCEQLEVSFAKYKQLFDASPVSLLDDEKHASPGYGLTVKKTFTLALEGAAKLHSAAEPLIVHASLLAPQPIPLFLFIEGRDKFDEPLASLLADDGLDRTLAALRAFALVDRNPIPDERDPSIETETIELHSLVREVAADRWAGQAQEQARRALISVIAAVYPHEVFGDPETWPRARRLDALAMALVDESVLPKGVNEAAGTLLGELASYRQGPLGEYAQAKQLYERMLAIDE